MLVRRGRSTPGLPGASKPTAAKGRRRLGMGASSPSRTAGEAMARTKRTLCDKRGMTLRRRGLASPKGNTGKVRQGPGVCISRGKAGP